jgi:predicted metalloprotease
MRWQGRRQSTNVEDRRGVPAGKAAAGIGGGLGVLILALIVAFMGGDPKPLLEQGQQRAAAQAGAAGAKGEVDPAQEPVKQFVSVVLADTEDVWNTLFQQQLGRKYPEATLVLFTDEVVSGCGRAQASMGPFYCPADEKVYIDLAFCDELRTKFKAPGDFAVAYVLAHEIGHHVQRQLGYSEIVDRARGRVDKRDQNKLSVRLELQADYLAGVWAHHAQEMKGILEPGDVEEALRAAEAVGDDRLQRQMQGYVVPDSFTHGTSEQRSRWFRKGLATGSVDGAAALFDLPENEL